MQIDCHRLRVLKSTRPAHNACAHARPALSFAHLDVRRVLFSNVFRIKMREGESGSCARIMHAVVSGPFAKARTHMRKHMRIGVWSVSSWLNIKFEFLRKVPSFG